MGSSWCLGIWGGSWLLLARQWFKEASGSRFKSGLGRRRFVKESEMEFIAVSGSGNFFFFFFGGGGGGGGVALDCDSLSPVADEAQATSVLASLRACLVATSRLRRDHLGKPWSFGFSVSSTLWVYCMVCNLHFLSSNYTLRKRSSTNVRIACSFL